jgi:hypothetical protein
MSVDKTAGMTNCRRSSKLTIGFAHIITNRSEVLRTRIATVNCTDPRGITLVSFAPTSKERWRFSGGRYGVHNENFAALEQDVVDCLWRASHESISQHNYYNT